VSPSDSSIRVEPSGSEVLEAVGEGPSFGGMLFGNIVAAMLRGRMEFGVVGYGGRRRYHKGVGGESRLAIKDLAQSNRCDHEVHEGNMEDVGRECRRI